MSDYDPLSEYPKSRTFDMQPSMPPTESNKGREDAYGTPNMGGPPQSRANQVPDRSQWDQLTGLPETFTGKPLAYQDGDIWFQSPDGDSSDAIRFPYRGLHGEDPVRKDGGAGDVWNNDDLFSHIKSNKLADADGNITLGRNKNRGRSGTSHYGFRRPGDDRSGLG